MIGDRTPCSKCYEPLIDDELLQEPNWFMPYCKIKEYADTHINNELQADYDKLEKDFAE